MLSLAGQVHLGRDAVVSEQADEDVGVGARSSLVPGDRHHLVHCTPSGSQVDTRAPRQQQQEETRQRVVEFQGKGVLTNCLKEARGR